MIAQSEDVVVVAISALTIGDREPFVVGPLAEAAIRRAFFKAVDEGFGEEAAHALLVFADVLEDERCSPEAAAAVRRTVDADEMTEWLDRKSLTPR